MKWTMMAALAAAQLTAAAQPAIAAELLRENGVAAQQRGTFAGARLRIPFGGAESGRARAGVAFTSIDRSRLAAGGERVRFGEGVELGFKAGEPLKLRLGGATVAERLNAIPREDAERKQRKTGKLILKGAAVVALVGVAVVGGALLFFAVACDGNRCSE
jgi:opacity protein-like surface antigen